MNGRAVLTTHRRCLLFLDFDGTLAPIVPDPERARLAPGVRTALQALVQSGRVRIVVISGRALSALRPKAAVRGAWYAGSHGREIYYKGRIIHARTGGSWRTTRPKIVEECRALIRCCPGIRLEEKPFGIAIHYRRANRTQMKEFREWFAYQLVPFLRGLRVQLLYGKKVVEVIPADQWNKGKSVRWFMRRNPGWFPVYIGDDVTDESAFRFLRRTGWGIRVGRSLRGSAARETVSGVRGVVHFLEGMKNALEE